MQKLIRFIFMAGLLVILGGVMPVAAQDASAIQTRTAHARVFDVDGTLVGEVIFEQFAEGVIVSAFLDNLTPGFHGFHIHTTGLCEPPFDSAGGHFNPTNATHDDHAGDLPSLLVTEDGRAFLSFITDRFDVADLFDEDGSAVMIHANADNFANIPERYAPSADAVVPDEETLKAGDSGARVACGVIEEGLGTINADSPEVLATAEPATPAGDATATTAPTTAAPTVEPTEEPTLEPTEEPTEEPTMEPTAEVTETP